MKYNNGANRQRFENEQHRLARYYKTLGMTDEAIHEMYKFDLGVLNSERRYIEHKATAEEMSTYDATGEVRYKDMDEFPISDANMDFSYSKRAWLEEIEDKALYRALSSLPDDYITIISMKMDGYTDEEIAKLQNRDRSAITHKIRLIKNKLRIFI